VDSVPDPLLFRKSGSAGNKPRTFGSVARNPDHYTTEETFTITNKIITRRLAAMSKNKAVGPDSIYGEILNLGGEAIIPYLARLLDKTVNIANIPSDWKNATVVPIS
jgi:hypothetical protein